jgi:hypothetical protein
MLVHHRLEIGCNRRRRAGLGKADGLLHPRNARP